MRINIDKINMNMESLSKKLQFPYDDNIHFKKKLESMLMLQIWEPDCQLLVGPLINLNHSGKITYLNKAYVYVNDNNVWSCTLLYKTNELESIIINDIITINDINNSNYERVSFIKIISLDEYISFSKKIEKKY